MTWDGALTAFERSRVDEARIASREQPLRVVAWTGLAVALTMLLFVDVGMNRLLAGNPTQGDVWAVSALHASLAVLVGVYLWRSRRRAGAPARSLFDVDRRGLVFLVLLVVVVAALNVFTRRTKPDLDPFLLAVFFVTSFLWFRAREALIVFLPGTALLATCIAFAPGDPVVRLADLANLGAMTAAVLVVTAGLNATRTRAVLQQLVIEQQAAQLVSANEGLEASNERLVKLAWSDPLTEVPNRRAFDEALLREWKRSCREGAPVAVIMADIDWFKAFNDTYGHPAGDRCLKAVASAIQASIRRPCDVLARYGGEEFTVVLPGTAEAGAMTVAAAVRVAVREAAIPHVSSPYGLVTISLGVAACLPRRGACPDDVVIAADRALYAAKNAGRDRVATSAVVFAEDLVERGIGATHVACQNPTPTPTCTLGV